MRSPALGLALALAVAAPAAPARDTVDLLNLRLAPELTGWLVGPMSELATKEEEKEFLALSDDAAAALFIERFWAARDPDPQRPGNPVRDLAEQRAEEADRRFSEGAYPGRRTDRGTILVLYGAPDEVEFQPGDFRGEPPVEVWRYPPGSEAGLDGKPPDRRYRFVTRDGETIRYVPGSRALRPRTPTFATSGR